MTKLAAERVFGEAGVSPRDVDVVELHDCFSANELITYEALGLCDEGMILFLYCTAATGGLRSDPHWMRTRNASKWDLLMWMGVSTLQASNVQCGLSQMELCACRVLLAWRRTPSPYWHSADDHFLFSPSLLRHIALWECVTLRLVICLQVKLGSSSTKETTLTEERSLWTPVVV